MNHKGTRMVRDGQDERRLQATNLKNLGLIFQEAKLTTMRALTHARGIHRDIKRGRWRTQKISFVDCTDFSLKNDRAETNQKLKEKRIKNVAYEIILQYDSLRHIYSPTSIKRPPSGLWKVAA